MFNSLVLDVAIGLAFSFLSVALVASVVIEAVSSALNLRSSTLLTGVKALLNDPELNDLALAVYNHAGANPRSTGMLSPGAKLIRADKPSYIDARQFANALIDHIGMVHGNLASTKAAIVAKVKNAQLQSFFTGMVTRVDSDIGKVQDELATWFDGAMDRVSGSYKRYTQVYALLLGIVVAAGLNVDALHVGNTLWSQPQIAKAVADTIAKISADQDVKTVEMAKLHIEKIAAAPEGLPIGWPADWVNSSKPDGGVYWLGFGRAVVGWLITALASLLGAPFWFDTLQRVISLRGTGPEPAPAKKP